MAKKKSARGKGNRTINGVTVGACNMGGVTITADVTIPGGAVNPIVTASILPAAGGAAVAGPTALTLIAAHTYSGRVNGIPGPGPYKAKVDALWYVATSDPPFVTPQFTCTRSSSPKGGTGADDCCG